MVTLICPWCEDDVEVEVPYRGSELRCPECSSSCLFEDEPEVALPLAA